jgi:hypothetical protein
MLPCWLPGSQKKRLLAAWKAARKTGEDESFRTRGMFIAIHQKSAQALDRVLRRRRRGSRLSLNQNETARDSDCPRHGRGEALQRICFRDCRQNCVRREPLCNSSQSWPVHSDTLSSSVCGKTHCPHLALTAPASAFGNGLGRRSKSLIEIRTSSLQPARATEIGRSCRVPAPIAIIARFALAHRLPQRPASHRELPLG